MTKYFEVLITKTSKAIGSREGYQIFDNQTETFKTINEIKEWLKETYKNCKRVKMYQDNKNNESRQTGWIYCFKNADWSHSPVENWWQQDWIEVREIKAKNILIN